ncbi:YugN family protein [Paenibacillus koleovorans]|uniref:YugN family protein n=1 Tax=Paenibacillus koleovorans TaxID=121608 RepID=UPI000FDBA236|nr:YugN family protein [Paenibacillus koleovorans]
MIIENTGLNSVKSDLRHLDESSTKLGFVRWQWEYYRATYDLKIEHEKSEYFLRINTRAVEGRLESPYAILIIESVYLGVSTFPHGLDYASPVPAPVVKIADQKLNELKKLLSE